MASDFTYFMGLILGIFKYPFNVGGFVFSFWDVFLFTLVAPMVISFLLAFFNKD